MPTSPESSAAMPIMEGIETPSVFQYNDYRRYLRDYYEHAKQGIGGFSYQIFAQRTGFRAKSHLANVLAGRKDLSPESIARTAVGLGLSPVERDYFEALVQFNQSTQLDAKHRLFQRLTRLAGLAPKAILAPEDHALFSNWLRVALLELAEVMPILPSNAAAVGARLLPPQPPAKISEALQWLHENHFLEVRNGSLRKARSGVRSDDRRTPPQVRAFHQQMAVIAAQTLKEQGTETTHTSTLTFALADEDFPIVVQALQRLRSELGGHLPKARAPDRVYHINFQIFPIDRGTHHA